MSATPPPARPRRPTGDQLLGGIGLAGLAASIAAAAIALANLEASARWASAAIAATTISALIGVGLYAWRRGSAERGGQLLVIAGFVWFFASMSNSDSELLYSIGRTSAWVFEVVLIYALLAYPTGYLKDRPTRLVVGFAFAVLICLYLPTAAIVTEFPSPSPFSTCDGDCPSNWFFVLDSQPGFVTAVLEPIRNALTMVAYGAVTIVLVQRLRRAGPNLRRSLSPVLGAAVLRFGIGLLYVALRNGGTSDLLDVLTLVAVLTIPVTALGYFVGLIEWRIFSGGALTRLTTELPESADPAAIREIVADTLGDPSLRLTYAEPADPDTWREFGDEAAAEPRAGQVRCRVEVRAADGLGVSVDCEEGFGDHLPFVRAVGHSVLSALARRRLANALEQSLREVEASRKRLIAAADTARQQIEQDLHDGAQQQLVTLRVKLELARETLDRDPRDGARQIGELGSEVDSIIEEVRSLARGIYPPLLASGGLGEALRAIARRGPAPISVVGGEVGRYPPEIESAVYFCCLEALQNASKHAASTAAVTIRLGGDADTLRFEVVDQGPGFSTKSQRPGKGITGMHDRIAAIGGSLSIESDPARGTRVAGVVRLG